MRHLLVAALLLTLPGGAAAQNFGNIPPGAVLGNPTTAPRQAGPMTLDQFAAPFVVTDNKTGAITTDNASVTALTKPGLTAKQIVDWIFFTAANPTAQPNFDAIRGVAELTPGSTVGLVNGVGGYVHVKQMISSDVPTSVALFGAGVVGVNGGKVWGLNTTLSDCEYRSDCSATATGRDLNNEIDLSFSSTHSTGTGLLFAGNSIVQPANATAITVSYLDYQNQGAKARWGNVLYSINGGSQQFAFIGALEKAGNNISSQPITFAAFNASGGGFTGGLQLKGDGVFDITAPVRSPAYTVATLPTPINAGARAMVINASACTFNVAVAGGGAVVCPVFWNGLAWVAG